MGAALKHIDSIIPLIGEEIFAWDKRRNEAIPLTVKKISLDDKYEPQIVVEGYAGPYLNPITICWNAKDFGIKWFADKKSAEQYHAYELEALKLTADPHLMQSSAKQAKLRRLHKKLRITDAINGMAEAEVQMRNTAAANVLASYLEAQKNK